MAFHAFFQIGSAIRRFAAKARSVVSHVIFERTILLLTVIFCAAVAVTLFHLSRLSSKLVESGALQGTAIYSESITDLRTFYNAEVVDRVRPRGVEVTHDYATKDGAIPIPATFTIEFGKHIAEKNSGMQLRLFSDYPFPFRKEGGPRDNFEKEALVQLRKQPDKPFFRFEDFQGRPSLRYATAVQMQAGCVACHNAHPESPRTDWQVGEVRGVQEIIQPLHGIIAQTWAGLRETFFLLAAMGVGGLGGLALVIGRMRRTSAELGGRAKEQEALNAIAAAVSQSLRLDELLQIALDQVIRITGRERASIRLKDPGTGEVRLVAHRGFSPEEAETLRHRASHSISEQVFASGEPLVINGPEEARGSLSLLPQSRSVAWIPLKIGGRVMGILGVSASRPILFSSREIAFLQALGNVIGVALENARLFEDMEKLAAELARSHKVKDEFLSIMSHELRTPLNVVMGYASMIKDRILGEINPEQEKALERVIRRAGEQLAMINSILQAKQVEAERVAIGGHEMGLGQFLEETQIGLRDSYERRGPRQLGLSFRLAGAEDRQRET